MCHTSLAWCCNHAIASKLSPCCCSTIFVVTLAPLYQPAWRAYPPLSWERAARTEATPTSRLRIILAMKATTKSLVTRIAKVLIHFSLERLCQCYTPDPVALHLRSFLIVALHGRDTGSKSPPFCAACIRGVLNFATCETDGSNPNVTRLDYSCAAGYYTAPAPDFCKGTAWSASPRGCKCHFDALSLTVCVTAYEQESLDLDHNRVHSRHFRPVTGHMRL